MKPLTHKDCGGDIEEDWRIVYMYDSNEDGNEVPYPALFCNRCHREILGDAEIAEEFFQ